MPFKKRDIEKLLAATGRKCCLCSALHNVQLHHIIQKSDGGTDTIENAIPLCPSCHDRVHVKPSLGRTTRDYTSEELKLHRDKNIFMHSQREGFENHSNNDSLKTEKPSSVLAKVDVSRVLISVHGKTDCQRMQIAEKDVKSFVRGEARRHSLMFQRPFSSIPLVYGEYVMLLSWNGCSACVERILKRQEAYPLNDQWTQCLRLYRKATLLPYRTQTSGCLLISSDAKLAVAVFSRLVDHTQQYMRLVTDQSDNCVHNSVNMQYFLDEAEFALVNGDVGTAVARLEAVLSTAHKLILRYAPQGVGSKGIELAEIPKTEVHQSDKKSVLIVDDEKDTVRSLVLLMESTGCYQCYTASCSREAMQLLVNRDFDLIITDMIMPDIDGLNASADGRELVLAAKRSGSKAKIIVLTAYTTMAEHASVGADTFPCDFFFVKPNILDMLETIKLFFGANVSTNEPTTP